MGRKSKLQSVSSGEIDKIISNFPEKEIEIPKPKIELEELLLRMCYRKINKSVYYKTFANTILYLKILGDGEIELSQCFNGYDGTHCIWQSLARKIENIQELQYLEAECCKDAMLGWQHPITVPDLTWHERVSNLL